MNHFRAKKIRLPFDLLLFLSLTIYLFYWIFMFSVNWPFFSHICASHRIDMRLHFIAYELKIILDSFYISFGFSFMLFSIKLAVDSFTALLSVVCVYVSLEFSVSRAYCRKKYQQQHTFHRIGKNLAIVNHNNTVLSSVVVCVCECAFQFSNSIHIASSSFLSPSLRLCVCGSHVDRAQISWAYISPIEWTVIPVAERKIRQRIEWRWPVFAAYFFFAYLCASISMCAIVNVYLF